MTKQPYTVEHATSSRIGDGYKPEVPMGYRLLAARILEDAVQHGVYFGDRKVFLSTIPSIDLKDKEGLVVLEDLLRTGALQFARADLVAAMDPVLVEASTWLLSNPMGIGRRPEYHFLVLPESYLLDECD